jgi:hypothetical protein
MTLRDGKHVCDWRCEGCCIMAYVGYDLTTDSVLRERDSVETVVHVDLVEYLTHPERNT